MGHNLRAIRQERGLSQQQMAEVLGIHRTYLGGLERGERNITLRTLESLSAPLEAVPADLLRAPDPDDG